MEVLSSSHFNGKRSLPVLTTRTHLPSIPFILSLVVTTMSVMYRALFFMIQLAAVSIVE